MEYIDHVRLAMGKISEAFAELRAAKQGNPHRRVEKVLDKGIYDLIVVRDYLWVHLVPHHGMSKMMAESFRLTEEESVLAAKMGREFDRLLMEPDNNKGEKK